MLKKDKSEALTKEYNKYYPGGHSNLRIPMDVTEHRLFIAKSDGTHLTDVDGNEYIEYNGSMGPNILGHKNPNFVKKVVEYIENNGTAIGSNLLFSPMDVEVAKRLSELETQEEELQARILKIMMTIPNIIDPSVPIGKNDTENVEVQRYGEPVVPDFEIPYHTEIMESFDGIDLDSARKVAGNGFYYLMGDIARLHSAVIAYARDFMINRGFTYCK